MVGEKVSKYQLELNKRPGMVSKRRGIPLSNLPEDVERRRWFADTEEKLFKAIIEKEIACLDNDETVKDDEAINVFDDPFAVTLESPLLSDLGVSALGLTTDGVHITKTPLMKLHTANSSASTPGGSPIKAEGNGDEISPAAQLPKKMFSSLALSLGNESAKNAEEKEAKRKEKRPKPVPEKYIRAPDFDAHKWLEQINPVDKTSLRARLLCFHGLGGSSLRPFKKWSMHLRTYGIDVWAVQLPGRGRRILEPKITSVFQMVMIDNTYFKYCKR